MVKRYGPVGVLLRWWAMFVVLALVAGCTIEEQAAPSPGGGSAGAAGAPPANHAKVTALIGAEGGTLEHPTGAKLVIPPGALPSNVELSMEGADAPTAFQLGALSVGQAFILGPEGQQFEKPVQIVVPFDATVLPTGADAKNVRLYIAPKGSHDFAQLDTGVNLEAGTLTAETTHFSWVAPGAPLNPNPVFVLTKSPLAAGKVGQAYTQSFSATGGYPPYAWSVAAGSLPQGLSLAAAGSLSGTPAKEGTFTFTVQLSDATQQKVQKAFSLTVAPSAVNNPVPLVTSVSPNSALAGSLATAIVVTGKDFVPGAVVQWDGSALATTYTSATKLGATIPQEKLGTQAAGTHNVNVRNPAPGGGASESVTFTVTPAEQNPAPTVTSIDPTSLEAGSLDTQISISGTNFISGISTAVIGTQGLSTHVVSATEMLATIPASFLSAAGTLQVGVFNAPPGGGYSNYATLTVGATNPAPTLAGLTPRSASVGSPATSVSFTGTGFVTGAKLFFGQTSLETTIQAADQGLAVIPQNLLASVGTFQVTLVNPGGVASNALTFTVYAAEEDGGTDGAPCESTAQCTGGRLCVATACGAAGTCQTMGCAGVHPYCGCDGRTYDSICQALEAGGNIFATPGACDGGSGGADGGVADASAEGSSGGNACAELVQSFTPAQLVAYLGVVASAASSWSVGDTLWLGDETFTISCVAVAGQTHCGNSLASFDMVYVDHKPTTTYPAGTAVGVEPGCVGLSGGDAGTSDAGVDDGGAQDASVEADTDAAAADASDDRSAGAGGSGGSDGGGDGAAGSGGSGGSADAGPPSVAPTEAHVGSGDLTITVTVPNGVQPGSVVHATEALATTYVNATTLQAVMPARLLERDAFYDLNVAIPGASGMTYVGSFQVTQDGNPLPQVITTDPAELPKDTTAVTTITITGDDFLPDAMVLFDGALVRPVTYVDEHTLQVTVGAYSALWQAAGQIPVVVVNPSPGGGAGAPFQFTVTGTNPVADITSIGVASLGAGTGDYPVNVYVSGSTSRTVITATAGGAPVTLGRCPSKCTLTVPAALLAAPGTVTLAAMNPAPNAGAGLTKSFEVVEGEPTPQVTATSPSYFAAGAPTQSVILIGSGFTANSAVTANDQTLTITDWTATTLTVTAPASLFVTGDTSVTFSVTNPSPGGGTGWKYVIVYGAPTISTLDPTTVAKDEWSSLQVTGSGFFQGSYSVTFMVGSTSASYSWMSSSGASLNVEPLSAGQVPVYAVFVGHEGESWGKSNTVYLTVQ